MKTILFPLMALLLVATTVKAEEVYVTEYSCLGRAQLVDGPSVSIVRDMSNSRLVKIQSRQKITFVSIQLVRSGTGATIYSGQGVSAIISETGSHLAAVTLNFASAKLGYNCIPRAAVPPPVSSCDDCSSQPIPSTYCKIQCNCRSAFCGQW